MGVLMSACMLGTGVAPGGIYTLQCCRCSGDIFCGPLEFGKHNPICTKECDACKDLAKRQVAEENGRAKFGKTIVCLPKILAFIALFLWFFGWFLMPIIRKYYTTGTSS